MGHAYFRKWLPGRDGAICVCVMAHDPSMKNSSRKPGMAATAVCLDVCQEAT